MAYKVIRSGGDYRLYLTLTKGTPNIAENYTPVTVKLYLKKNSGTNWQGLFATDSRTWSWSGSGITSRSGNYVFDFRSPKDNYGEILLRNETFNVSHNADGSRGNLTVSATVNFAHSQIANTVTISESVSFTTIPRASTFTIPSSFNVGSAFTVSISRTSGSFTHEVAILDGGTAFWWSGIVSSTNPSSTVPADDLLARMTGGVASKAFTLRVTTYNGSTYIGQQSKTITANIPISTFTAPTSFTMGDPFDVSISRVGSLTHIVTLDDGSTRLYSSGIITETIDSVNVALSTLAARSPNSMSRTFTVKVATFNGNDFISDISKNITAYVPASVKPTFTSLTHSEYVSSVASLVGAYVQNKSQINWYINGASGIYGSTIRSYSIVGHSLNTPQPNRTTGLITQSGNLTYTAKVTDSRGQTFERESTVNVLEYTPPALSNLSFKRTLPDKTEAPLGNNVTVTANVGVHSLIVNGVEKNSIKYHVESAQVGGSYVEKTNETFTGLTKNYSDVWSGYSVDHSYNFRVRVGDVFGWGGWTVGVVPTGIVTQQWSSKTTSFGKMIDDTSYNVQVGTGGIQSDGPIIDKHGRDITIDSGSNSDGSWIKYPDGTLICYHNYLVNNVTFGVAHGSLYPSVIEYEWAFPVPFVGHPSVSGLCNPSGGNGLTFISGVYLNNSLSVLYRIISTSNATMTAFRVTLTAVGRWK